MGGLLSDAPGILPGNSAICTLPRFPYPPAQSRIKIAAILCGAERCQIARSGGRISEDSAGLGT